MGRPQGHMVLVAPEADFIARLDAELVTEILRDDNLALRSHTMSHTEQYNLAPAGSPRRRTGTGSCNLLGWPDVTNDLRSTSR